MKKLAKLFRCLPSKHGKSITWIRQGDCIRCTSHAGRKGYAVCMRKGWGSMYIHRSIALRRHGYHQCSRHSCDNPWCINPDHILPGTLADNNKDRSDRGRNRDQRGEKNHSTKLSESDVGKIRAAPNFWGHHFVLARQFGVSRQLIGLIRSKEIWRHVP